MSIDVCIGNYGYYNEGELRDAWISLPKTSGEIGDFLSAHGLQDPEHEEIYISDYDGVPFGLTSLFSEFTHLDDLNMLARQMEERPDAVERVQAALDCGIDGPKSVIGLMNWIEQDDEIPYQTYDYKRAYTKDQWGQTCIERLSAEENYGRTVLEGTELMRMLERDGEAMSAFDVERYGELCSDSGDVWLGDQGYVDSSRGMPREDLYTREELAEMYGDPKPGDSDDGPGEPHVERGEYTEAALSTEEKAASRCDDGMDLTAEASCAREVSALLAGSSLNDRDAPER